MQYTLIGVALLWTNLFSVINCQCSSCPQITTSTTTATTQNQCTCLDTSANCPSFKMYCSILNMQENNPCPCTCGSCPAITTTIPRYTYSSTPPIRCIDANPVTCQEFSRYCFLLEGLNPHPCLLTCKMC